MALIYVVEDDKNIREIERFALQNSGYRVEEFECARDFYKRIAVKVPQLVLLDIMLPDEDGLAIVKKLRMTAETKKVPVIMVTAKTTEIDKVKGLDLGADDYITKPFGVIDSEKHMVTVNDEVCELTFKEYELLKLLMTNAGIVMTRDVIMERVWGVDFEGESRTLDMHIKTLRQKLKESGSRIKTVRNVGYIME